MKCPKCGYVRVATDQGPDFECPRCGIVYAKFGTAAAPVAARVTPQPEPAVAAANRVQYAKTGPMLGVVITVVLLNTTPTPPGSHPIPYWFRLLLIAAMALLGWGLGTLADRYVKNKQG